MKYNSAFFLFFIIGGFLTAAAAVAYFASGVSYRGTDAENYTLLLQIPPRRRNVALRHRQDDRREAAQGKGIARLLDSDPSTRKFLHSFPRSIPPRGPV